MKKVKNVSRTVFPVLLAVVMTVFMAGSVFAADAGLTIDGEPTLTGSLIPAWAGRGVESNFYIGVIAEGENVSGILADQAQVSDGVVSISGVNVTSELGDALNELGATNTTYLYVNGGEADTNVVLEDSTFVFSDNSDGKNANDFTGAGAVVVVTGSENTKTTATLKNVDITTDGFGRDAVIVDAYANVLIEDSNILTKGSNPLSEAYEGYASSAAQAYMISPPWILGIYGGVRAANTLGTDSSFNLINSTMETGGWAIISTDDCTHPTVNVLNSNMIVTPYDGEDTAGLTSSTSMQGGSALFGYEKNYGSAYGTYNIGSSYENFYGAVIDGTTYATILTGAGPTYFGASYDGLELVNGGTGEVVYTYSGEGQDTVVNSVFGVMDHQGAADTVLDAGSVWNTEEAVILVRGAQKSAYTVSGAEMNPASGIIFQMMDDDDGYGTSGGGGDTSGEQGFFKWTGEAWGMPTFSSGFSDPNEAGFVAPSEGGAYNTTLNLTTDAEGNAVTYTGDVYNGTGTGAGTAAGGLMVLIDAGVTLEGAVSSASSIHGLPYNEGAVAYLDELAALYGEEGISPDGGEYYTVKYTLLDADGNIVENEADAAYIQLNEFTMNEYYIISHVINKVMAGPNVLVSVAEGGAWTVTSDSYIKGLINGGTVTIADGAALYINGEAYTGVLEAGDYGDLSSGGAGGTVDTADWVIGENYRTQATGKYSDIVIDGNAYYYVGSAEPVSGAGILDVAFIFQGWLKVNEDGSYAISKDYIEMEQPASGGGPGGGESAGDPGAGDPGAGDPGAGDPGEGGESAGDPGAGAPADEGDSAGGESSEQPGGAGDSGGEGGESAPDAGEAPAEEAAPAADTSEEAYHAYLKEYVRAVPAVEEDHYASFDEVIDASDYTAFPADMLFTDTYFGFVAMSYDEFVAAGGVYEIPAFDPNLTAD